MEKPIRQVVLNAIEEVQEFKADSGIEPELATMLEIENAIRAELKDAIRELIKGGTIEWHPDINKRPMFRIKK